MKQRKSPPPALPQDLEAPESSLGFTIWVHLVNPASAAEVRLYRQGLDRYLDENGLSRSMNPLHMLVWAAGRSLTMAWLYRVGHLPAEQCVEMLGGFQGPVTLH